LRCPVLRTDLEVLKKETGMDQSYLNLLKDEYAKRRRINPQYSLRSFARYLNVHPGTLNNVFNQKRSLSLTMAKRITDALCLSPAQEADFLKSVTTKKKRLKNISDINLPSYDQCRLDEKHFKVLAEWEHYGILSLINTDDFKSDVDWMAERLGISKYRVEVVLQNLQDASLIELKDGEYCRQYSKIQSSEDVRSKALRASHKETLENALYRGDGSLFLKTSSCR
jgi:uncharacterized protein (TIGR02147 family)